MNSDTFWRAIGWTIAAGVGTFWAYNSWVVQPERQRQRHGEQQVESQRLKDWAYVAKEKEVAPGETIKLVVIPSPLNVDFFDIKCLIYTNREFKTSSMICPDADRSNLADKDE